MSSERENTSVSTPKRHYEVLVMREFKSTIPPHLLASLPDDERFMVETMSKLEGQFGWLADAAVRSNAAVVDLDTRASSLESLQRDLAARVKASEDQKAKVDVLWDWKQYFSGKWVIIAGLGVLIAAALIKLGFDYIPKLFHP